MMMTERLYYDNAYLTEFDACVISCQANGNDFDVLLDRSAFYPTSGGQPFDTGTLNGKRVIDVYVQDGLVWHTVAQSFDVGENVHGMIDWTRRFDHMQQHAGDHMIAGALYRMLGGVTIGLHISDEISTIDVSMSDGRTRISEADIQRIEWDVNAHIQRNVPIRCWFPDEKELENLPLRKKPTVSEHIRIVAIGDDEMVACGGTHPSFAGEIGLVKILSVAPARGKMRVTFLAGQRALKNYFKCYEAVRSTAELLSTNADHLYAATVTLQEKLHSAESEIANFKKEHAGMQLERLIDRAELLKDGTRLVACLIETDTRTLREMVSELIKNPGIVALMGAKKDGQVSYVFGRSENVDADMGQLLREAASLWGGKGGGRSDFAQGGGGAEILESARKILKKTRI